MKRFTPPHFLALCLGMILLAVPALAFNLMIAPSGQPAGPVGLDSEQPDTIRYDIGGYYYLYGPTNLWGAVRFTAPSDFELRCVYIQMTNPNGVSDGVNVTVNTDNAGQPGTVITGPYRYPGPLWLGGTWLDVEIDQPYPTFTAGQDFFVVFGPAPTGSQSQGWFLFVDNNGNTESRSGYSNNQSGPFQYDLPGDLIVRAGGETASYTDLTVLNCYNDVQKFFLDSGAPVLYKAEVKNVGSQDVTSYRVIWTVQDTPGGAIVFADSADYGALAAGATALQTCPTAWTTGSPGYYIAQARVWNVDDPLLENNSAILEQGIGALGFDYFKYDDGEANTNVSTSPGMGWGNRFTPPQYPVKIDSIQVGVAAATTSSDVRIVSMVGQTVTLLWNYNGPLNAGMNTLQVDTADINIFTGNIGVGYIYQTASIYLDSDPPIAATNTRMPTVAYQIQSNQWVALASGDWMLRAFCSESSALPPYPLIRVEPDTLNFGEVTLGDSSVSSFWVYNDGGENLNVTNIAIPTPLQDELFITNTAFTVLPVDSEEVQVTWIPTALGNMQGTLSIMNNATAPYPKTLPVRGTAIQVGVEPAAGAKPMAYALHGNFPNPFNPTTAFRYELPSAAFVTFKAFDLSGRLVATLVDGWRAAGSHEVTFDGSNLASGIYLYWLQAGAFSASGKMVLMK